MTNDDEDSGKKPFLLCTQQSINMSLNLKASRAVHLWRRRGFEIVDVERLKVENFNYSVYDATIKTVWLFLMFMYTSESAWISRNCTYLCIWHSSCPRLCCVKWLTLIFLFQDYVLFSIIVTQTQHVKALRNCQKQNCHNIVPSM